MMTLATPSLLVLIGLPGSGKSTFCEQLATAQQGRDNPLQVYQRVNQDELGDRHACRAAARNYLLQGQSVVVDRCHHTIEHRKLWFDLVQELEQEQQQSESTTSLPVNIPIDFVHFTLSSDDCIARCQQRRNHPTLPPREARRVVGSMKHAFQPPRAREGYRHVYKIQSDRNGAQVIDLIIRRQQQEGS